MTDAAFTRSKIMTYAELEQLALTAMMIPDWADYETWQHTVTMMFEVMARRIHSHDWDVHEEVESTAACLNDCIDAAERHARFHEPCFRCGKRIAYPHSIVADRVPNGDQPGNRIVYYHAGECPK